MLKKHVPKKQKHDELSELEKQYMIELRSVLQDRFNSTLSFAQIGITQVDFNRNPKEIFDLFLKNLRFDGLKKLQDLHKNYLSTAIDLFLKKPSTKGLLIKIQNLYKKTIDFCYKDNHFEYAMQTHEIFLRCQLHLTPEECNQIKFNYKNTKLTFNPNETIEEFKTDFINTKKFKSLSLLEKQKYIAYSLHELFQLSEDTLGCVRDTNASIVNQDICRFSSKKKHIFSSIETMKIMHKKIEKDVEYNRNLNTQISRYEKSEIDLIKK